MQEQHSHRRSKNHCGAGILALCILLNQSEMFGQGIRMAGVAGKQTAESTETFPETKFGDKSNPSVETLTHPSFKSTNSNGVVPVPGNMSEYDVSASKDSAEIPELGSLLSPEVDYRVLARFGPKIDEFPQMFRYNEEKNYTVRYELASEDEHGSPEYPYDFRWTVEGPAEIRAPASSTFGDTVNGEDSYTTDSNMGIVFRLKKDADGPITIRLLKKTSSDGRWAVHRKLITVPIKVTSIFETDHRANAAPILIYDKRRKSYFYKSERFNKNGPLVRPDVPDWDPSVVISTSARKALLRNRIFCCVEPEDGLLHVSIKTNFRNSASYKNIYRMKWKMTDVYKENEPKYPPNKPEFKMGDLITDANGEAEIVFLPDFQNNDIDIKVYELELAVQKPGSTDFLELLPTRPSFEVLCFSRKDMYAVNPPTGGMGGGGGGKTLVPSYYNYKVGIMHKVAFGCFAKGYPYTSATATYFTDGLRATPWSSPRATVGGTLPLSLLEDTVTHPAGALFDNTKQRNANVPVLYWSGKACENLFDAPVVGNAISTGIEKWREATTKRTLKEDLRLFSGAPAGTEKVFEYNIRGTFTLPQDQTDSKNQDLAYMLGTVQITNFRVKIRVVKFNNDQNGQGSIGVEKVWIGGHVKDLNDFDWYAPRMGVTWWMRVLDPKRAEDDAHVSRDAAVVQIGYDVGKATPMGSGGPRGRIYWNIMTINQSFVTITNSYSSVGAIVRRKMHTLNSNVFNDGET